MKAKSICVNNNNVKVKGKINKQKESSSIKYSGEQY